MKTQLIAFCLLSILCVYSSCKKEKIELLITEINTPLLSDLQDVSFLDEDTIYVVGGQNFSHGLLSKSYDGGTSWIIDTVSNHTLNDIYQLNHSFFYTVGFNGTFIYKTPSLVFPLFTFLQEQEPMYAVHFMNAQEGIAVGGGSFNRGIIYRFNSASGSIDTVFSDWIHEFSDVDFSDPLHGTIVGYGIILETTDGGYTWTPHPIEGDFFNAIHFPTAQVGYITGLFGTILKTTDGGSSWKKIRKGSAVTRPKQKFKDIRFSDETNGYIVGDEGLFWKTNDGGKTWQVVENIPNTDLQSIFIKDQIGFIVGEQGKIFKFVD